MPPRSAKALRMLLCGLAIVFSLLFIFAVSGYTQSETVERNSNESSANQKGSNANGEPTQNKPAESQHPQDVTSHQNDSKTSEFSYKDVIDITLTLALLVVVIGQAIIARRQARIYDQQREIMQRQVEHLAVIDRAYIEIVEMRIGALKVDETVIVKTVFQNVGRSPAWNFRFSSALILLEKSQPLKPEWLRTTPRGKGKLLPAGKELVNESPSNFHFTREQVQALFNKTAKLYDAGALDYIDITGTIQTSRYLRIYDPETGLLNEYEQADSDNTN
jgi:hypothetical protein